MSDEPRSVRIEVSPRLQELFASAVINGKGGYQSLCRVLKARLVERNVLELTPAEFKRVVIYAVEHGSGGFQAHFRELVCLWTYQHLGILSVEVQHERMD